MLLLNITRNNYRILVCLYEMDVVNSIDKYIEYYDDCMKNGNVILNPPNNFQIEGIRRFTTMIVIDSANEYIKYCDDCVKNGNVINPPNKVQFKGIQRLFIATLIYFYEFLH